MRGKGALNAAQRSGTIIGQEKKFAVGNAVSNTAPPTTFPHSPSIRPPYPPTYAPAEKLILPPTQQAKGNTEGQRQKKLDDTQDIIKPKTVGKDVGKLIMDCRQKAEPPLSRDALAKKCMITGNILGQWENGTATPDQKIYGQIERALNVRLRGDKMGEPLRQPKKA